MTQSTPGNPKDEPWFPQAYRAMECAVNDDMDAACGHVEDLFLAHGWQGLQSAMQAWADWAMRAIGIEYGTVVKPQWRAMSTGEIQDGDTAPPAARWAGRMLVARAAGDADLWMALLDSLPDNSGEFVEMFLDIAARQIREARS